MVARDGVKIDISFHPLLESAQEIGDVVLILLRGSGIVDIPEMEDDVDSLSQNHILE